MSESHFVTSPIGFVVKDDTLYVITGKKEHDLNDAKAIAAGALSVTADAVTATPPETVPAMIKVLVMKQVEKPPAPAESDHYDRVLKARESVKDTFSKTGFNAAFPRKRPNVTHPILPTGEATQAKPDGPVKL